MHAPQFEDDVKLLMVARRFPPDVRSGTETVFENLWLRARLRHQTRLVVGYVRSRDMIPADALGVDLRDARRGAGHVRMWRASADEARQMRPDAVLSNSIEVAVTRYPTACIIHDLNFGLSDSDRGFGRKAREWLYRLRASRLDAVITPSRATRDALLEIGVPSERIHVVHNGVDLDRFRPVELPASEVLRIAYPGRILPGKGQHVAIDAVARLPAAAKARVKLVIVGAVADEVYLEQLRVQAKGQPVEIHTEVDDIARFYQQADLVLFPTIMREGFGFTAIEAMACGKPVVFTDQPAIREANGGIGVPVPPDDAVAVRDAILACLDDPSRFAAMGVAGRAFVADRYHWDRVWDQYERVLTAIH